MLKGQESLRLRTYCTSTECMEPSRDLESYGRLLMRGDFSLVEEDHKLRVSTTLSTNAELKFEEARELVAQDLFAIRWGPTKVPIFNLLGLFSLIVPQKRKTYLSIARYLIDEAKVPVDGTDLSGTTALSHSFSTKPSCDLEYAQMLWDAGGEINNRNRYGGTVGQEICQVYDVRNQSVVQKAMESLEWYLKHGGSVDIADSDGHTARSVVDRIKKVVSGLWNIISKEDQRRQSCAEKCCTLCGREPTKLLMCGRCKRTRYCDRQVRTCQALDWPRHKKECKA